MECALVNGWMDRSSGGMLQAMGQKAGRTFGGGAVHSG
ncbi:hypothetical protein C4J83_5586 [Pseudomonas sp. LBUM920]|nr:hypothetical protein C4J83_5586 [Pseudomonas sp. LBUM920]